MHRTFMCRTLKYSCQVKKTDLLEEKTYLYLLVDNVQKPCKPVFLYYYYNYKVELFEYKFELKPRK